MDSPDHAATLREVRRLYDLGLSLRALEAAAPLGHPRSWRAIDERLLAARLALQLGAPRLALRHRLAAWREAPDDPEVAYYRAVTIESLDGPWPCWRFLAGRGEPAGATPDTLASWSCLAADCLATLRDFDRAEEWLARAERADPGNPWVATARSGLLVRQDRLADALAAVDEALVLAPWYRPAVQARVGLLALANRDAEAFEFLGEATARLECASLQIQLALLLADRDDLAGADAALDRYEALSPLLERSAAAAFLALRAFVADRRGDEARAIDCLRRCGDDASAMLARRLSDPARAGMPRIVLPVPFVRQHHLTCAPATLASISLHWARPAEHVEVAERICYDGTSSSSERRWAEGEGWAVREFTVTAASAVEAIGAGIPFTLTTHDPGSAHLQAVAGVDRRRGTIVIRDPSTPLRREMSFEALARDYGAFGPRGMALVPASERHRLDALDLPDSSAWETLHRIDGCLEDHRRAEAGALVDGLRRERPGDIVTLLARRRLAHYDGDPHTDLAVVETLLPRHPDCDALKIARASHLRTLSRREDRLAMLEAECGRPFAHPIWASMLAAELAEDATQADRVLALARRVLRLLPADAAIYSTLARVSSAALDHDAALELHRVAACLDDKNEHLAEAWFDAARERGRTEEALDQLRRRVARVGRRSGLPARTLAGALRRLERPEEGLAVLEKALLDRPDDGDLALAAAWSSLGLQGGIPRARAFLARARGTVSEVAWLECAGAVETLAGDRAAALAMARRAVEVQPLSVALHAALAHALDGAGDRPAALEHLAAATERFPFHRPLATLHAEWLRGEPAAVREPIVRRLIDLDPANAWATRELGFLLVSERRLAEAEDACRRAAALDPHHVAAFHLRAALAAATGDSAAAKEAHRGAIRLSVDDEWAIDGLLGACDTLEERRAALTLVREEIVRQTTGGDGLLSYRLHAAAVLDPAELLGHLVEAHAARPDLWHAWVALAWQQAAMHRLDDADATIRGACRRFPHLPRVWLDRARICRLRDDGNDERDCLVRALDINPRWQEATRLLSEAHQRRGDRAAARTLLERAVAAEPGDGVTRGWLADLLWADGDREAALAAIERAVELAPAYEWAWDRLREWSAAVGAAERAVAAARRVVERRPGDPRGFVQLATSLPEDATDERLAAIRRARELTPHDAEQAGLEARFLAESGRLDEALAVCRAPFGDRATPPALRAREGWILWRQGKHDDASRALRSALADDPSLTGGWFLLLSWTRARGTPAEEVAVAESLVRLLPHDPAALAALGEALSRAGEKARARDAFARSHEVSTADSSSGNRLFDLLFEDGDRDAARDLVRDMLRRCPDPWVFARGVRVAAADDDFPTAAALVERLCRESTTDPEPSASWPFRTVAEACEERGWGARIAERVAPLLDERACHPEAAAIVIRGIAPRGGAEGLARSLALLGRPGAVQAMTAWVEAEVRAVDLRGFRRLVRRERERILADTDAWGAVTLGWTLFRDWDSAAPFGRAHRRHPRAPSWMLVNAAEILRVHGRHAEAAELSRRGLGLPGDFPRMLHGLWLATDGLRSGDLAAVAESLSRVPREGLDVDYGFLHDCLSACVELAELPPAERRGRFPAVARRFDAAADAYPNMRAEPARRAVHRVAMRRIASLVGGARSRWWWLSNLVLNREW